MAKVKCEVYDKTKKYLSCQDIVFRKVDYIHALLLMNGTLGFTKKVKLFFSYLFKLICDLDFSSCGVYVSRDFEKTYDGVKREMAEIYGAANTIIVALKQFSQKSIFPFNASSKGMRPDFIAEDSAGHHFLFESKGSINQVRASDVDKSIKQINNILSTKKYGSFSAGYSVVSDFNSNSSKPLSIRIYDPRLDDFVFTKISFEKALKLFRECVCNIIDDKSKKSLMLSFDDKKYICITISLNKEEKLIFGIDEELYYEHRSYDVCCQKEDFCSTKDNVLNRNVLEEETFDDGLYLKILKEHD